MSNLKKIVASLELCNLIPENELTETVLVWNDEDIEERMSCNDPDFSYYPAPTLPEILDDLPDDWIEEDSGAVIDYLYLHRTHKRGCCNGYEIGYEGERMVSESDTNPTNAALRLWLKLKGIEVK